MRIVRNHTLLTTLALPLALGLGLAACGGDDEVPPDVVDEEEIITTVTVTMTDGTETLTARWEDPDGPGGSDPTVTDPAPLTAGTTYEFEIELLNESETPTEDITEEIREEAESHLFFFVPSNDGVEVEITDVESTYGPNAVGEDLPVGLQGTIRAVSAGTTSLDVVLKHLPPVGDQPQKTADTTIADGGTDVDVTFELTVQ